MDRQPGDGQADEKGTCIRGMDRQMGKGHIAGAGPDSREVTGSRGRIRRTAWRKGMEDRRFLLDVRELQESGEGSALWKEVLSFLDQDRILRLDKIKDHNKKARAACAGAGLLMQWACFCHDSVKSRLDGQQTKEGRTSRIVEDGKAEVGRTSRIVADGQQTEADRADRTRTDDRIPAVSCQCTEKKIVIEPLSVREILHQIPNRYDFELTYTGKGKPYLKSLPFFFNLSHSGEYVFCGVSEREIGVDIQRMGDSMSEVSLNAGIPVNDRESRKVTGIAERFFAEEEKLELRKCVDEKRKIELFYRLWTRKEALGKLLGEGVSYCLGRNLCATESGEMSKYRWEEYDIPDQYKICVCKDKKRGGFQ